MADMRSILLEDLSRMKNTDGFNRSIGRWRNCFFDLPDKRVHVSQVEPETLPDEELFSFYKLIHYRFLVQM